MNLVRAAVDRPLPVPPDPKYDDMTVKLLSHKGKTISQWDGFRLPVPGEDLETMSFFYGAPKELNAEVWYTILRNTVDVQNLNLTAFFAKYVIPDKIDQLSDQIGDIPEAGGHIGTTDAPSADEIADKLAERLAD